MEASEGRSTRKSCAVMECGDGKFAEAWRREEERTSVAILLFVVIRCNDKIMGQKVRSISGNRRFSPPVSPYLFLFGFL